MATTTIHSITVTGNTALVKGQGPANARIFVAIKTAGTMLGQGTSFGSGNFEIQTHNLNPGTYIAERENWRKTVL